MLRARSAAVTVAAVLALAAGGGPLAAAADESSKSPKEILNDLARDLRKVKNYHFAGWQVDSSGRSTIAGDVTASGKANVVIRQGGAAVRMVLLPSAAYLKGNAAYWKMAGGKDGAALGRKLGDRWVKVPGFGVKDVAAAFADLTPKHLASCAGVGTGTLSKGGEATVAGRKAVVIVDRGDKPGTTPGRLYAAASGPVLPLRVVQTGRRKAGGHLNAKCQDKDDDSRASDVTFGAFDKKVSITAPKGAITIPGGGGAPGTPA
jgi:hypothetical protein